METAEISARFEFDTPLPPPSGLVVQRRHAEAPGELLLSFPLRGEAGACISLTKAEREVAADLLLGFSNRKIADHRRVSVRTIANQIGALFRKLQVHSRLELALCLAPNALGQESRPDGHREKALDARAAKCPKLRTG